MRCSHMQLWLGACNTWLVCLVSDPTFAASQLACHIAEPTREHLIEAKQALRYLAGTRSYELRLGGVWPLKSVTYSDTDFANCTATHRSITGYVMMLGDSSGAWACMGITDTAHRNQKYYCHQICGRIIGYQ
jgi:hypothetical protein